MSYHYKNSQYFYFYCARPHRYFFHVSLAKRKIKLVWPKEGDSSNKQNRWLLLMLHLTNFTAKHELVFVLTQKKVSSQRFNFKPNRKFAGFSKNSTRDFWNGPPFKSSAHFYVTISEDFEHFECFNFETSFFLKKTKYRFLVESTIIESPLVPYKAALSKDNVKANSMGSKN